MKSTERALAIIKEYEGLRLEPYTCPAGHATIGYGHKIHNGPVTTADRRKWEAFDEVDASRLLADDLVIVEDFIRRAVKVPLTQCRHDALVSLAYNCPGALQKGTGLSTALARQEWALAGAEILKWHHAAGKDSPGLMRRRAAERALFDEGGSH